MGFFHFDGRVVSLLPCFGIAYVTFIRKIILVSLFLRGVAVNFTKIKFKLSLTHRKRIFRVDDYLQGAKFVGLWSGLAAENWRDNKVYGN